MTPTLRKEYQVPLVDSVRGAFSKDKNGHFIVQLGTGGGKTIIFSYIASNANQKGNKVLILSDRTELLEQASGAISMFGVKHTKITPKTKWPDFDSPTVLGMSQTLKRRISKYEWIEFLQCIDLLIIDECHKQEFNYIFESGIFDNKPVLGFTATPVRTGSMRQLGMDYHDIIQGVSIKRMVELGYLVPERYFGVDPGDVSAVPYNYATGDYQSKALYSIFNSREKYSGVVDNYRTHTDKTKALTFCVNISHAVKTAAEFNDNGISSMFLVSNKSKPKKPTNWDNDYQRVKYEEDLEDWMTLEQYKHLTGSRRDVINSFRKNKFLNLVNADILTTGFDMPDIETIIINRSTLSLQLYLQFLGRGSRISPDTGKIMFTTLDFGNHAGRAENNFGRYMDDRTWGLWHEPSKGGGVAPTKICPPEKKDENKKAGCNRLIAVMYQICPFCGFKFPTKQQIKEVELKEMIYQGAPEEEVLIRNMNYLQLSKYRELKKYHMGWLVRILNARGGEDEVKKGMRAMGYSYAYIFRMLKNVK